MLKSCKLRQKRKRRKRKKETMLLGQSLFMQFFLLVARFQNVIDRNRNRNNRNRVAIKWKISN